MNQFKILILSLVLLIGSTPNFAQEDPYNVLFIAIDDLNDYLGFMEGNPQAITPNFDRLASESVIFTNAQCPAPKCAPSRNAILSGVYPHDNYVPIPLMFRDIPELTDRISLPQHFKENGYKTMTIGKIFHKWNAEGADSLYSWDVLKGLTGDLTGYLNSGSEALPIDSSMLFNNLCLNEQNYNIPPVGPISVATEDYVETATANWVGDRLHNTYANPFFLAAGFFKPHIPYYAPKEWFDLYQDSMLVVPQYLENDLDDIPLAGKHTLYNNLFAKYEECEIVDDLILGYLANVSYVDYCLGIILDRLDTSPHKDNTIVILWSDHGHHLGEKDHFSKNTLYEESARIPLLIKVPGLTSGGQIEESPANLMDLYPTLIELCNLPEISDIDGRTLVPLLDDERNTFNYPSITTLDTFNHTIRTKQFRYNRYADGSEELYNHEDDPNEWTNLALDSSWDSQKDTLSDQMDDILDGGNGLLNEIPRVKWILPIKNETYFINNSTGMATIPFSLDAYDIDGVVTKVEVWVDNQLIGILSQAPYEFEWNTNIIGNKLLKALVKDNDGKTIWSRANYISVDINTSIENNNDLFSFSIQPNPITNDYFEIELPENIQGETDIFLYNPNGILIQKWTTYSPTKRININNIPNGIYFIEIINKKKKSKIEKIILQNK